jgi:hypothetical protein
VLAAVFLLELYRPAAVVPGDHRMALPILRQLGYEARRVADEGLIVFLRSGR